jgi:hypothetical protein
MRQRTIGGGEEARGPGRRPRCGGRPRPGRKGRRREVEEGLIGGPHLGAGGREGEGRRD